MSKLIKCKACGGEVAKGAKRCPKCGKDNRSFVAKHKIISAIGGLIIIGVIGSAIGGGKDDKATVEGSNITNTNQAQSNTPQIFKVGETVKLKDYKITVNKVYDVPATEMFKPKDGNKFLAADITIENISDKQQAVSSLMMFKVVDKDGRACEYSMTGQSAANAGQLDGTVEASRKITGVYTVEVAKDKTGLELEFDSSIIAGKKVIVNLN